MLRINDISQTVLQEIGWDDGQRVPIANQKNKELEEQVINAKKQVEELTGQLTENNDRVNALNNHLKNVRQELQNTQSLYQARKMEMESEEHLKKIMALEENHLKTSLTRMDKEICELKDRQNLFQNNRYQQEQKIDEIKKQMDWDQKTLDAWLEECSQKDEDAMTIQKYSRQDEAKIKELSLKIGQLTDEFHRKRRHLDNEMTETNIAQMTLDKTADQFRKAHAERQEILAQWETTIDQMQRRDAEMDLLAAQLVKLKKEVRSQEALYREKQQFYENEQNNNKEYEEKIKAAERVSAKVRLEHQECEKQLNQFRSDMDALKRQVDRTASDLEASRAEVTQLKKEIENKEIRLAGVKRQTKELEEKLEETLSAKMSAEERRAMMDKLLEEEEKNQTAMQLELTQLRDVCFKKTQLSHQLQNQLKCVEGEIQGTRSSLKNYASRLRHLDQISLRQQEMLYNQDFHIQMLERRLGLMKGETTGEDSAVLEEKISELKAELESRKAARAMLIAQMKRLTDDMRKIRTDLERGAVVREDLMAKINEVNLCNGNASRELKKCISLKQEKMVEDNMLKLDIKRLRDMLYEKADKVHSQEKHRLQLEIAMKERQQEIKVHIEMLNAQLKTAETERSQISMELHDRISKIDKLKKRFEILSAKMAPPEGEEEKSQAYYVIKAAQEKEELQRAGDVLDAKVRKAEKELKALSNTLQLMTARNEMYRKGFTKIPEGCEEAEERKELEDQLRALNEKYRYKRRQIGELEEDIQAMLNTVHTLNREEECYSEALQEKQDKIQRLKKELEEQQIKIERVKKMNEKSALKLRSAARTQHETDEERDFNIRELKELTKAAVRQIGEVIQKNPEIGPTAQLYFSQAGLAPPSGCGLNSGAGSRISSSNSSTVTSSRSSAIGRGDPAGDTETEKYLNTRVTYVYLNGGRMKRSSSHTRSGAGSGASNIQPVQVNIGADINLAGTDAHGFSGSRHTSTAGSSRTGSGVGSGPNPRGSKSGASSQRSSVSSASGQKSKH